jgi:hypothetical protein
MQNVLSKINGGIFLGTMLAQPVKPMFRDKGTIAFQTPSPLPTVMDISG